MSKLSWTRDFYQEFVNLRLQNVFRCKCCVVDQLLYDRQDGAPADDDDDVLLGVAQGVQRRQRDRPTVRETPATYNNTNEIAHLQNVHTVVEFPMKLESAKNDYYTEQFKLFAETKTAASSTTPIGESLSIQERECEVLDMLAGWYAPYAHVDSRNFRTF